MESEIAIWARSERAKRRVSQATVAAAVSKSRSWLASLERAEFRPRVEDCALLATYFESDLATVLGMASYSDYEIRAIIGAVELVADALPEITVEARSVVIRVDDLQDLIDRSVQAAFQRALEQGRVRAAGEPSQPPQQAQPPETEPEPKSAPRRRRYGRRGTRRLLQAQAGLGLL